jgi:hypothetical protein
MSKCADVSNSGLGSEPRRTSEEAKVMLGERRGWATRVELGLVNWRQEEPAGFRQTLGGTSRMSREGAP